MIFSDTAFRRGVCLVVAAPSGAGKSTVTRALLASDAELFLSVSATTRPMRPGEVEGIHYYFKSEAEFGRMAEEGALLEHASVFNRSYGTPRAPVEAALQRGHDVLLDVDWQGYRQVKAAMPADTVGVFILPPSMEVLEQRLRGRASDPPEEIDRRMGAARREIAHCGEFDHIVINDCLDTCIATVRSILAAHRCRTDHALGAIALANAMVSS
jgi:guanylate kinase